MMSVFFTSKGSRKIITSISHFKVIKKRDFCPSAVGYGYLDLLKWARENACRWDEYTCVNAAEGGYLEILKWAERMDVLGMKIRVLLPPKEDT